MEVSQLWSGHGTQVRMLPVTAKCDRFPDEQDASEENARFWDATPAGEAKQFFHASDGDWPCPYAVGQCVYFDMEPGDGDWKLEQRTQTESQMNVSLVAGWHHRISMSISNQDAWSDFGGKVGAPWSVTITPC